MNRPHPLHAQLVIAKDTHTYISAYITQFQHFHTLRTKST